jgi:proline racemase
MAVLEELGYSGETRPSFTKASSAPRSDGRVVDRVQVGERWAIVPEIEGAAWITGEHTFLIDGDDPLSAGFRL